MPRMEGNFRIGGLFNKQLHVFLQVEAKVTLKIETPMKSYK